jgi:hypothetical protein
MEMEAHPVGGYIDYPGQSVMRILTYLWPRGTWLSTLDEVIYPTYYQPWIDLNGASRYDADYQPRFDFSQPNPTFYDAIRSVVDDARAHGVLVHLILMQGSSYGGDPWTYNPFRAGNNVNDISVGSYDQLETNPPGDARAVLLTYIQTLIQMFPGYGNVAFEVMNEGDVSSDSWQETMVDFIHSQSGSSIPVVRSALLATTDLNDPNDPLVRTWADAISVGFLAGQQCTDSKIAGIPTVSTLAKPVYFDTDHNCSTYHLSAAQFDALYCKGYNILSLGTSDPAAEDELARIGRCASDPAQCPRCP